MRELIYGNWDTDIMRQMDNCCSSMVVRSDESCVILFD